MKIKLNKNQYENKYHYALALGYKPKFIDVFKLLHCKLSRDEWACRNNILRFIDQIVNYKMVLVYPFDIILFTILNIILWSVYALIWCLLPLSLFLCSPLFFIILILVAKDSRIYFNNLSEGRQQRIKDLFFE